MAKKKWPDVVVGERYGDLLVIEKGDNGWWCECDCAPGKRLDHPITDYNIKSGRTVSCGCHRRHVASDTHWLHGESAGGASRTYQCWASMISRCTTSKVPSDIRNYQDRGIKVCKRWFDYRKFRADMRRCPNDNWELDRKDNDKGYCPSNCRWETKEGNRRNRRGVKFYSFRGVRVTAGQLSDFVGGTISPAVITYRIEKQKLSVMEAIATIPDERVWTYTYRGKEYTPQELAKMSGLASRTIIKRINGLGWSVEDAVEKGKNKPGRAEKLVTWQDREWTIRELAESVGMKRATLRRRILRQKWPVWKAIGESGPPTAN